jgi:hypothetical protein
MFKVQRVSFSRYTSFIVGREIVMLKARFVSFLSVAAIALTASAAFAEGLIEYDATAAPTAFDGYLSQAGNQFWTKVGGGGTGGTLVMDDTTPAWKVPDGYGYEWRMDVAADDISYAQTNGWTLSANLKVLSDGSGDYYTHELYYGSGNSGHFYKLAFSRDSSSNPKVRVTGSTTTSSIILSGPGAYHDFSLVYDPASNTADFFFDGVESYSNMAPGGSGTWDNSWVVWGDSTSTVLGGPTVNCHQVQWDGGGVATPEPSTLLLLGIGVFGLLAYAWRKRR